jgi:hypothetical protein
VYWGFELVYVCEFCERLCVVVIPIIDDGFLIGVALRCRHRVS